MRERASDYRNLIAILAVDAGIAPWDARNRLTLEDATAIIELLNARNRHH